MASSSSAHSLSVSVPQILSFLLFYLFKWSHHLPLLHGLFYTIMALMAVTLYLISPPFSRPAFHPATAPQTQSIPNQEVPILHFPPHSSLPPSLRDKYYRQPSGPNQNAWAPFPHLFPQCTKCPVTFVNSVLLLNLNPGHFFPFS